MKQPSRDVQETAAQVLPLDIDKLRFEFQKMQARNQDFFRAGEFSPN